MYTRQRNPLSKTSYEEIKNVIKSLKSLFRIRIMAAVMVQWTVYRRSLFMVCRWFVCSLDHFLFTTVRDSDPLRFVYPLTFGQSHDVRLDLWGGLCLAACHERADSGVCTRSRLDVSIFSAEPWVIGNVAAPVCSALTFPVVLLLRDLWNCLL